MGSCVSTADLSGKERSDDIEKQFEEDSKRFKRERTKGLLLGECFPCPFWSVEGVSFICSFAAVTFEGLANHVS